MPYSVLPPRSDSPGWKILDDHGEILFTGSQQICEEFLDLADLREAASSRLRRHATDELTNRPSIFEQAAGLLRRFSGDSSGEVRVSAELPVMFLMMVTLVCLSSHFLWPAVVQQASLTKGASDFTYGNRQWTTCAGMHDEPSCASSRTPDMVCDAEDDTY